MNNKLMTEELFNFFSECEKNNNQEIVIIIDDSFKNMQEIFDHIGKCIYKNFPNKNPIYANSYYFGSNLSAFSDCLSSFFHNIKGINLIFLFISINKNINNKDVYIFLYLFLQIFNNFDYEDRLKISISKPILGIYLSELDRLLDLDTDSGDVFG